MNFNKVLFQLFKKITLPIKTIIFCDPGIDDALMLVQILCSNIYDIKSIVPVAGNVNCQLALQNTLAICEYIGKSQIKIYPGSIEKDNTNHVPVYGETGLGSVTLPAILNMKPQLQEGISFTCEALQKDKYLLISTGPLTEPAKILQTLESKCPSALKNIIGISMMAGVINSTQEANWPVAGQRYSEANLASDAQASKVLFDICTHYNVPIFLAPLDLTHSILASENDIDEIKQLNTPAGKFAYQLVKSVPLHYQKRYSLGPDQKFRQPLHDVHASHCLLHPNIYHGQWVNIQVSTHLKPNQISITNHPNKNVFLLDLHYLYRKEFFNLLGKDLAYP